MSLKLIVSEGEGERVCSDRDGLWTLGGLAEASVVLPGAPERLLAYIGCEAGHFFIQPAAAGATLRHNGVPLTVSAWLGDGDRLTVGGCRLRCRLGGETLRLEIVDPPKAPAVRPPSSPPPGSASAPQEAPPQEQSQAPTPPPRGRLRRRIMLGVLAAFGVLLLAAGFVLFAVPVNLRVDPAPDSLTLAGFPPALHIAGRRLALPGRYHVRARLAGYQPLDAVVRVSDDKADFAFSLTKLPGKLTVVTTPVAGAVVKIDGQSVGVTPLDGQPVAAGEHVMDVIAERYLPVTRRLEVAGMGAAQKIALALSPAWAVVALASQPAGAEIAVDGAPAGRTPARLELLAGRHRLTLNKPDFEEAVVALEIIPGADQQIGPVVLTPSPGQIVLTSRPAGATVTLDDEYLGRTPLEISLAPEKTHKLRLALPGFQTAARSLKLKPAERRTLDLALKPEYGTLFVRADPADATLKIDGKSYGKAARHIRLTTVEHRIEISKPGYEPYRTRITPRAGLSDQIAVTLKTIRQARFERTPAEITTAAGQKLRLITPGAFLMGASRREAGRRANERQHRVVLTRRFYLSQHTVTNGEFRRFKPEHRSGVEQGRSLDLDKQPVVMVSWDDAARYLNWLSARDKLPPAYVERDGRMVAVFPPTLGYRLPSEAEWAWAVRRAGRTKPVRYAWGDRYPPTGAAGNYADASARGLVPMVVATYNDGYPVSAPVGSFPANPAGLFDLGSNVAEWCQDFYDVYPPSTTPLRDPLGPRSGVHHVVRGASWRSANISRLRLSFRDYSADPKKDLGFRIARTAEAP